VQSKVTRFRAPPPGGTPNPPALGKRDEPGQGDRPMPIAASIFWTPVDRVGQPPPDVPIFMSQQALSALHDHSRATPAACFGLLGGALSRSPDGAPYLVVESVIRLPAEPGQDAKAALPQGWVVALDLLRRSGTQLVGWYRAGESTPLEPSRAELEAHAALFPEPWQVLVTSAAGATSVGGVYRPAPTNTSVPPCLPFFELLDSSSNAGEGSKQTRVPWTNYRSDVATFFPATGAAPAVRASPRPGSFIILPDEDDAPDAPPAVPRVRGGMGMRVELGVGTLRRLAQSRAVRVATVATGGVVAALGLLRAFRPAPLPLPPPPPAAAVATVLPQERLDRAGDTLALAIAAFDLRARLFASRQMQCPELARGLVLLEERWTAYNAIRKDLGGVLDSAQTARDRALYADADAVEQRFERSRCPRP
jgi:hypothetical protein